MKDINSLSHTKWNCKYHIVFAPKYRRKTFYENNRLEIGALLRELCRWKGVNIIISTANNSTNVKSFLSINCFIKLLKKS